MKKKLLASLLMLATTLVSAQDIKTALAKWHNDYPQEKVFLQTDAPQYLAGETIYMKAWCALDGGPSDLSRIIYVNLVNAKGEVVLKKMYRLDSTGSTPADLEIPATVPSGNYVVNAYTLWMLNFPDYIYQKHIYIYNADYKNAAKTSRKPVINLHFFPEGGDLVAGIKNRVAFKGTDDSGLPVVLAGVIADNTGSKVASFTAEYDGMGSFEIPAPDASKTYKATVNTANGGILTFDLPKVNASGVLMRVENTSPARLFVILNRSEKDKALYNKLRVVAQMNGQVVYNTLLNVDEGETTAPISKKNLPPGILQITVFNEANQPLAERLAFIENYDIVKPTVQLDVVDVKARGKNKVSFRLEQGVRPDITAAVTSASLDDKTGIGDNIAAALLLTSDLKGYVNNPAYYFSNKEVTTLHHLDLLLMTQGWRRFAWKKVLLNEPIALTYPVESGISVRGTVHKSDRKEVVTSGKVSFVIKGDDSTSLMAEADITDKGEFLLDKLNYRTSADIAYMGTNAKKEAFIVDVNLVPAYADSLHYSPYKPQVNLDTIDLADRQNTLSNYLTGRLNSMDGSIFNGFNDLGNVTVRGKKYTRMDSLNATYAWGPFSMGMGIDPDQYKNYITIWQMIQAAVPGVEVTGDYLRPSVSFSRFNNLNGLSQNQTSTVDLASSSSGETVSILTESNGIAYFLNEVNVSQDVISTIGVPDVALIKVLKNEAGALGATQGAIAIYTKKGVSGSNAVYDKRFEHVSRMGYAVVRTFFSPDYGTQPAGRSETDKRHTLFWNARMRPNKDGQYTMQFYNNDLGNKFKLIIQGLGSEGQLIFTEQIIK